MIRLHHAPVHIVEIFSKEQVVLQPYFFHFIEHMVPEIDKRYPATFVTNVLIPFLVVAII